MGGLWSESVSDCNDEVGLKISQKGLYALQAMMTLARRYQQGAIKVRDIASEADVPGKFLELILLELKKGAMLTTRVSTSAIAIVFGLVLIGSAYLSRRPRPKTERETPPDPLATRLRLNGRLSRCRWHSKLQRPACAAGMDSDVWRWNLIGVAQIGRAHV